MPSNEKKNSKDVGYMKTADKIVSVEDERAYFERKNKKLNSENFVSDKFVMTVDDIHTAEDEGRLDKGLIEEISRESHKISPESEGENIHEIKKFEIEKASFEDEERVARARLVAQKEVEKKKMAENNKDSLEKTKKISLDEIKQGLKEVDSKKDEAKKSTSKDKDTLSNKKSVSKNKIYDTESALSPEILENLKEDNGSADKSIKNDKVEARNESNSDEKNMEDRNLEKGIMKDENSEDYGSTVDKKAESKEVKSETVTENKEPAMDYIFNDFDDEDKNKKLGLNKFLKKLGLSVVAIVVLVYVAGCIVFNGRFLPNTTVNGMDVSYKTPKDLDKMAEARLDGYTLKLKGRNKVVDKISGADIKVEYVADGKSEEIKRDQGFLTWPIAFINGESINGRLTVKYDEAALDEKLKELNIFDKKNIVEPTSAYPDYDVKAKKLVVNKGDLGSTPIESKVEEFVKRAVEDEAVNINYPDGVYKPRKNDENNPNIKNSLAEIEKYINTKIVYDFGYEKYTVDGKDIVKMFDVDTEGDYKTSLSKDKVREVVRSLSRKYSTYGATREINSASTGGKLKVSGGVYGWLIDREKETNELYKLVSENKSVDNREPIWAQKAAVKGNSENDMGNEFIEIDLTKQHMWFVRDGEVLVSTPIVSGNPYEGSATPTGIYPLNYKTRNATLRGPGYASPVSYWMPFNGDIGIHDANWQPYFGGSRYLGGGSHGCINTPYGKAGAIYKLAKEDMPVVVHK